MPDEPEKPGEEPEVNRSDDGGDRPTVNPPFDPVAFARDVLRPSPFPGKRAAPSSGSGSADRHTRATPAQGTEAQPAQAWGAKAPQRSGGPRSATPTSTLSLANVRIPTVPPLKAEVAKAPAPPGQKNAAGDTEWADFEVATRPPPADGSTEAALLEIARNRPARVAHDDLGRPEEKPPPQNIRKANAQEEPPKSPPAAKAPEREMNDRMQLGDYSGALEIAEKILRGNPSNPSAKLCAETCRTVLRQMYAARVGPLERVPVVMVPRDQLRWLSIDHKAGFVLSLVDGVSSLEMIIDVSGMPELDTLRILSELAQQRIISLR